MLAEGMLVGVVRTLIIQAKRAMSLLIAKGKIRCHPHAGHKLGAAEHRRHLVDLRSAVSEIEVVVKQSDILQAF
jgi:hypothetical protein